MKLLIYILLSFNMIFAASLKEEGVTLLQTEGGQELIDSLSQVKGKYKSHSILIAVQNFNLNTFTIEAPSSTITIETSEDKLNYSGKINGDATVGYVEFVRGNLFRYFETISKKEALSYTTFGLGVAEYNGFCFNEQDKNYLNFTEQDRKKQAAADKELISWIKANTDDSYVDDNFFDHAIKENSCITFPTDDNGEAPQVFQKSIHFVRKEALDPLDIAGTESLEVIYVFVKDQD